MTKIVHPLIGPLEYEEESVITFQEGIIGLEENKRWLLLQNPKHQPFQWLQSIDNPEITLMVIDPWIVRADYSLSISQEDQGRINLDHLQEREDSPNRKAGWILSPVRLPIPPLSPFSMIYPISERRLVSIRIPVFKTQLTLFGSMQARVGCHLMDYRHLCKKNDRDNK